jgi:hypothetical protein
MTEEQKQKQREADKRYRDAHKDEINAKRREKYKDNPEHYKAINRKYRSAHHNEIMRKMREREGYAEDAAESIAMSAESKEKRRRDSWIYERYEQETAQDIASRYYNNYGG